MTYVSLNFIFFLAAFFLLFFMVPGTRLKQAVVLAGNICFYYFAGGIQGLFVILFISLVTYAASRFMGRIYEPYDKEIEGLDYKAKMALFASYKKKTKLILIPGIILIIGFLVFGKAFRLTGIEAPAMLSPFLMPLGLSYYALSSTGYMLDVFWKKTKPETNPIYLILCVSYFPAIVEGPINKYSKLIAEFKGLKGFSYEPFCRGLQRVLWGFFKKLVIADRLNLYTSVVYKDPGAYAGFEIIIAVILGAIQLYTDFSGCIDIGIGISEAIGVKMPENFNQPFFAKSAAEFWRRWHISLGDWFKEYISMPLAVNQKVIGVSMKIRKLLGGGRRSVQFSGSFIPLMSVWILTGLWHGTGLDYLVWGLYWGVLFLLESVFAPDFSALYKKAGIDEKSFGFKFYLMARTFIFFCIGRMFTVAGSLTGFAIMFKRMFLLNPWVLFDGSLYTHGLDRKNFYTVLFAVILLFIIDLKKEEKKDIRGLLAAQPRVFRWLCLYMLIFTVAVFGIYGPGFQASDFVYRGF